MKFDIFKCQGGYKYISSNSTILVRSSEITLKDLSVSLNEIDKQNAKLRNEWRVCNCVLNPVFHDQECKSFV